jgi:hypothetical protein
MKKIMFNERFGLQQAVIAKYKTMTRRIINGDYEDVKAYHAFGGWLFIADTKDGDSVVVKPAYEVGETIAIAQAYKTLRWPALPGIDWEAITDEVTHSEGWTNKMFVKAEYMPHAIRITGIKAERLQSISEADIMREGIHEGEFMNTRDKYYFDEWGDVPNHITFKTPRLAFQSLIDKVCKRGTWKRNPWVFAYEFELVR